MPAKAVDAGKRLNRNDRFRGHGPLLQSVAHPRCQSVRSPAHPYGTVTNGIRARMIPVFRPSAGDVRLRS